MRAIFLDADLGRVTSVQTWPTASTFAKIVAARDRDFVTQRGNTLALYSLDAKELRTLSLPTLSDEVLRWRAYPSPTGKTILFSTSTLMGTAASEWVLVNTSTLEVVRSWKEVQSGGIAISDNAIAMAACMVWFYHCEPQVEFRHLTTDWEIITGMEKGSHGVQFIDEDTLFLLGAPWKLLRTDGKTVLTETAPFHGGAALASADGRRFVVPFFKQAGRVSAVGMGGSGELKTISVYDAPFHERAYQLEVKGTR
jgi:hypothetical protein